MCNAQLTAFATLWFNDFWLKCHLLQNRHHLIAVITRIAMVQLPTSYDHRRLRYRMEDIILLTMSNAQLTLRSAQLTLRSPRYSLTICG